MTSEVNKVSLSSYDSNHELYDKVRPDFPDEAVDKLVSDFLHIVPGESKIVELASGTGKFTKSLVARGLNKNGGLIAVEPSSGMNKSFKKNFPNNDPPVYEASAYDMSSVVKDTSVDAVIIAQAFHWFADKDALKELARVLKDDGKLALIWNYEDIEGLPETNWQVRLTNYIWSFDHDVPQYRRQTWRKAFTDEDEKYFELPWEEDHFKTIVTLPREMLWPYWASRSYITALSKEKQEEVKKHAESIIYDENIPASDIAENGDLIVRKATHIVAVKKISK